jgi:threonine dehydrogenase-like Zn-dependent dehydrogenase
LLVVTDIDGHRLKRAELIYSVAEAARCGVKLLYVNTANIQNPNQYILSLTNNKGFDDVFVMAPVKPVVEQADNLLGKDGCLNFFAGPTSPQFFAELNLYNVHYAATHIVGTSGGNTNDMREALSLMAAGTIRPALMVTHIGGLDSVVNTTLNLPKIPGGKKLIYTNISLELTAIDDFPKKAESSPLFKELAAITNRNQGVWSLEAEAYLLSHAQKL